MKLVKEIPLENNLNVCFYNHNHRYFGDYHRVKVEITCKVPLKEEYFTTRAECVEAINTLGLSALFKRSVEQMGVSSDELEPCLERIIDNFISHALSYLASPEFPRMLIKKEMANSMRTVRGTYPG